MRRFSILWVAVAAISLSWSADLHRVELHDGTTLVVCNSRSEAGSEGAVPLELCDGTRVAIPAERLSEWRIDRGETSEDRRFGAALVGEPPQFGIMTEEDKLLSLEDAVSRSQNEVWKWHRLVANPEGGLRPNRLAVNTNVNRKPKRDLSTNERFYRDRLAAARDRLEALERLAGD